MATKTKGRRVPVEEPPHDEAVPPTEPPSGPRNQTLPSILTGRRQREVEEEPMDEGAPQGARHVSREDDTAVTLEEYSGVQEILNPGRTAAELDARTEVNTLQMIHFSRARVIARRFGIKYLDDYVTSIERLALSHKRKSRLEHVRALNGLQQQDERAQGLLSRLG